MNDVTIDSSPVEGLGVCAERPFDRSETVLVIDTSRVVDDARPLRPERGEREEHTTLLGDDRRVLLPPPERHLNHSCDPNAYLRTVDEQRRVVARRPIERGEEVTVDYLINTHGGIPAVADVERSGAGGSWRRASSTCPSSSSGSICRSSRSGSSSGTRSGLRASGMRTRADA